jgi:hypothetical protein
MAEEMTTASIKSLLKFPFKEQDWKSRFLVGSLLVLACFVVPIAPWLFAYGYYIRVLRRASKGEELSMPAWDDWGALAKDGVQGLLVQMAYVLPGLLVYLGGVLIYFVASFGLPMLFAIPMAGSEGDPSAASLILAPLVLILVFAGMAILFISMFLGMALIFLGAIPLPMALAHFAAQGNLSAAFRVKEWWPLLRANKLGYFIAWVIVAGLVVMLYWMIVPLYLTFIFSFLVFIVLMPIYFYLLLVSAAVFGRTYWESAALLAAGGQEAES